MFDDDVGDNNARTESTHKRKRDDFDVPAVPSFPVLARKKPRVGECNVAGEGVVVGADVVSVEAVASALGGTTETGGDNQQVAAFDEDEQTFMLPGDELSSGDEEDDLEPLESSESSEC